ncbi:hypothetical protein GCM10023168_05370 [Fodinibacter luteus]|uniref:Uncharacterized protein n=1 Tax=Fodinibacter luteus TaxID=552064 RepID=A0ABP8K0J7_9MICO
MPNQAELTQQNRNGRKALLALALAAPLIAAVALFPPTAVGDQDPPAVDEHAAHAAGLQDELARVRAATAKFHRVEVAEAAGYELGWVNGLNKRIVDTCISNPTAGAMGYHYFNADLMADNDVDALEPEVLVYAPAPDGGLKLVAVEWVVRSAQSNPVGVSEAPSVLGMDMHILVPPPGPAFYLTHAWVWANNPAGMFADFNPEVSC